MLPPYFLLKLLYRGTLDGFKLTDFQRKFYNTGSIKTVLILKSKDLNRIFGGYTDVEWKWASGSSLYGAGNLNSFLFTFVDQ